MACAFGNLEMVRLLLELGVKVGDLYRNDENGLSYWSNLITIVSGESLLSAAALNPKHSSHIIHLLSQIDLLKYQEILSILFAHGLDVNYRDNSGSFALGIACREGHTKLVEYLLNLETVNVNQLDINGVSSLMEATAGGNT